MGITGSIIVYVSIWWIVFFSVLPIGIKSENKAFREKLSGNDSGAPKNPQMIKKFIISTLITTVLFSIIYYIVKNGYFNLREYLS